MGDDYGYGDNGEPPRKMSRGGGYGRGGERGGRGGGGHGGGGRGGGGYGDASKVDLRFLIPSKMAGSLIGKSGSNVKELREKYAARINLPDSQGPERVLSIFVDRDRLSDLLRDIISRIAETRSQERGGGGPVNYDNCEIRMLVHQSQAGCVIGKGGTKIKEYRESTGLSCLKVFGEPCPLSTDRIVFLAGELSKVVSSIIVLLKDLDSAPPRGPTNNYDPENYDPYTVSEYGGCDQYGGTGEDGGGGRGGSRGGRGGPPRGGRGGMRGGNFGGGRGGSMRGVRGAGFGGRGGGRGAGGWSGMDDFGTGFGSAFGSGGIMDNFGGGMAPSFGGGGAAAGPIETEQVSVPNKFVGAIMGRGGVRVNEIRIATGAEIKVGKPEPGNMDPEGERIITIEGTTEQIQNAQYMMQMAVKQHSRG